MLLSHDAPPGLAQVGADGGSQSLDAVDDVQVFPPREFDDVRPARRGAVAAQGRLPECALTSGAKKSMFVVEGAGSCGAGVDGICSPS